MSNYMEYGVTLTDGQKSKLASAIINQSPLTLRLKHSHLRGNDELMLTKRQIDKINKSIANGTGSDIKISKTQIRKSIKPLSNFDLMEWIKRLGIKNFRGIYSRDGLPHKIKKECGIINLDDITGPGTHWVCYRNGKSGFYEYFDPFGLIMPNEVLDYFHTGPVKPIVYSMDEIQNRSTVLCGYWCLYYLLERQRGKSPYNDLENQVRYDSETGEILEIYDQPTGPTDAVAMQHDVDYSVCGDDRKCKNKADRKMVKSLDAIPWKERQWGHTLARTIINTKQKLGLGLNASRR
ncbi:unnamed protein product [Porites lobata]|uniref:Uncharacterized protein n=1 Tax=Porites lobata TaxID=104759 RepID=A0ABN8N4X2_9CNID|nr:unnamed protein product [Porites lobata]